MVGTLVFNSLCMRYDMKYVNDKFKDKVFYISNGWSGSYTVRQYSGNVPGNRLELDTEQQLKQFKQKLEENGWYAV